MLGHPPSGVVCGVVLGWGRSSYPFGGMMDPNTNPTTDETKTNPPSQPSRGGASSKTPFLGLAFLASFRRGSFRGGFVFCVPPWWVWCGGTLLPGGMLGPDTNPARAEERTNPPIPNHRPPQEEGAQTPRRQGQTRQRNRREKTTGRNPPKKRTPESGIR